MTTQVPAASGLGGAFNRLWAAAMTSNLADGIARIAIPLAAVAITKDPVAIALLGALAYVPWLLFSVPSGMIVDRIDRRVAMAIANGARLLAAVGVALIIATGHLTVAWLAIATLIFGLGETLFDNATTAVTPSVVGKDNLDRANGRIQAAQVGVDMFVATPIGGVLYSIAVGLPMIVGGAGYAIAAGLALTLPIAAAHATRADALTGEVTKVPSVPIKQAIGFVWHHKYLRSLVIFTTIVGTAFSFAQAVTALVFLDAFGVTPALFGVVAAGIGIGGVAGSLLANVAVARIGRGHTMLWATVIGGAGLLGVGFAPNPWIATVLYGIGAGGVSMWNVPWGSLRQAIIPGHMLGRAIGAIRTFGWSLMPIATLFGGWVAKVDLQLPFIIGGAVSVAVSLAGAKLLLQADNHYPAEEPDEAADAEVDPVLKAA